MAVTAYHIPAVATNSDRGPSFTPWAFNFGTNHFESTVGLALTDYLVYTSFNFSTSDFPTTATILGIEFSVTKFTGGGTPSDETIRLVRLGSQVGTNKATGFWSGGTVLYGGSADLWGTSWTPTQLHDNSFGIAVAVAGGPSASTVGVSHVSSFEPRMRVYYDAPVSLVANVAQALVDTTATTLNITGTVNLLAGIASVLAETALGTTLAVSSGTVNLVPSAFAEVAAETTSTTLTVSGSGSGSRISYIGGVLECVDQFSPKAPNMRNQWMHRRRGR